MQLRETVALAALKGFPARALPDACQLAAESAAGRRRLSLEVVLSRLGVRASAAAIDEARRQADRHLTRARELGMRVVPWTDAAYPARLAAIPDPPPVLWLRGRPEALSGAAVAVVGSRGASPYALEVAGGWDPNWRVAASQWSAVWRAASTLPRTAGR